MKRVLIIVLIVLLLALGTTVIINGFKFGDFTIFGFRNLRKLNNSLENKLEEASELTSVTYPEKISALTSASKQLISTKEKYQDKVAYSSEEDVRKANEIETFKVDFIFTRLGNHAKKYGLVIDLDAKKTSTDSVYNLNFTVHGKYALISEFIRAVENDQELTFTIESFSLELEEKPETLKATFTVPELRLDIDESISNPTSSVTVVKSETSTSNGTNTTTNNSTSNKTTTNATTNSTGNGNTSNTIYSSGNANTTNTTR